MATFEKLVATWSGGSVYARGSISQGSQSTAGNYTNLPWNIQSRDTHGSIYGTWDFVRGGAPGASSGSFAAAVGTKTLQSGTVRKYHDANGNLANQTISCWLDVYYGTNTASGAISIARIPLAPSITQNVVDTIGNTTARLKTEINNYGHGTSASTRMYYKKPTDGGWTPTSDQNDISGYNTWNIAGLIPNTKYYTLARWWNNNGDQSDLPSSFPSESYKFYTLASGSIGTPINLLATSVTLPVTITASASSEANPTTKIQYRVVGANTWTDTPFQTTLSPSYALSSLLPNTSYEYRIAVTNITGTWNSTVSTFKTLPAGKLVYPNGDVKNAIPRVVMPNGDVTMLNINLVD